MRRGLICSNTPPEWNIRVLTEDDFYQYCDEASIVVREVPLEQPGLSFFRDDNKQIFVNDDLRGPERLFVCFHELAHYWLHPPSVRMFFGWGKQIEMEADIVAACAMIPKPVLIHNWPSEIAELHGYPHWIVRFRCEVHDRYRI